MRFPLRTMGEFVAQMLWNQRTVLAFEINRVGRETDFNGFSDCEAGV